MFGYVLINKPELKFREFFVYRSFYCGLCETLRKRFGTIYRVTLSYDLTFLTILLSALYDSETKITQQRCVAHPLKKHQVCQNIFTEYAADMNIFLSYEKCIDDWNDEKKILKRGAAGLLAGKNEKVRNRYENKIAFIMNRLDLIHECEKNNEKNIDKVSGYFGDILGEIYVYKQDEWEKDLRQMGFYLGKFIYLMDAYEDIKEDIEKHRYNPLISMYQDSDFEKKCQVILKMMMAEACKAFERLPIVDNVGILRNILYSGVWTRYEMIMRKRRESNV